MTTLNREYVALSPSYLGTKVLPFEIVVLFARTINYSPFPARFLVSSSQ